MSLEAMVWALKTPCSDPLARIVLISLANYADPNGYNSWPSGATLAEYAQCSLRSVRTKLADLESQGLIRRGDQRSVKHLPGNRRPVVWDLAVWGAHSAPLPGVHVASPQRRARGEGSGSSGVHAAAHKPVFEPNPPTPQTSACSRHVEHDSRCRACARAQDARDKAAQRTRELVERESRGRILAAQIGACPQCDDRGYLPNGGRCDHDPHAEARALRGAELARQALQEARLVHSR